MLDFFLVDSNYAFLFDNEFCVKVSLGVLEADFKVKMLDILSKKVL